VSTPTTNSAGNLVWKPQVGLYAKVADKQRESYGGIVGALQDTAAANGFETKSYPHNFAGIIAAIQDLTLSNNAPPVTPGPNPGNGSINADGEWEQVGTIDDGRLWFDTRQGRLFIYVNNEWIQTNGADGLAVVTDTTDPPVTEDTPALGQFWFSQTHGQLFIHDGNYIDSEGNIVPSTDPGAEPFWRLINGASDGIEVPNTATVALAGNPTQRIQVPEISGDIIQAPDLNTFHTQQDYNIWSVDNLLLLEEAILNKSDVVINDQPPENPTVGLLWYDTSNLDLSIYYIDEEGDGQWVPTATPYTYDSELDAIRASITSEAVERQEKIDEVYAVINGFDFADSSTVSQIQESLNTLQSNTSAIAQGNYAISNEINSALSALDTKIEAIVIPPTPDLTPYATTDTVNLLETRLAELPTQSDVSAVIASIPNVSSFVNQQNIDTAIELLRQQCLSKNGGVINGNFVINRTNYDTPALDFSSSYRNSSEAFKLQSKAPTTNNYVTYGATNKMWEQAWKFAAEEDFCWIYNDAHKVFSITKDGPACSQLYLGDFATNDDNGRIINNKIDVRDRITSYQSAFNKIRQAVNNSTDYDSLKAGLITALANV